MATINSTTGLATGVALGTSAITASLKGNTSPGYTLKVISPFVVTTTADNFDYADGQTTLREAILAASASNAPAITFDPTVFATPQTITLTMGELGLTKISGTLTIQGPGANLLSISGNRASRVFYMHGGSASLSGLTITGGYASEPNVTSGGGGGGLEDYGGSVTLTNCTISGNVTPNNREGGGLEIFNPPGGPYTASATLNNCTVTSNSAGYSAGMEVGYDCTLMMTNCTVSGNSSLRYGGLRILSHTHATLTDCGITNNGEQGTAGFDAAGLYLYNCTTNLIPTVP